MTLASTTQKVLYAGNGLTTTFAIPFSFFSVDSHIEVWLREESVVPATEALQTNPANYTIVGTNVEMGVAPSATQKLLIKRILPLTQGTNYIQNVGFPIQDHEDTVDKLTMISQQLQEIIDRCAKLSNTSQLASLVFPEPDADLFIGWNSLGTGLENKTANGLALNSSQVLNNAASSTAIAGLAFALASFSSVTLDFEIHRTTSSEERFSNLRIYMQNKGGAWRVESAFEAGDFSGVVFSMSGTQLQYASDNMPGTGHSGTLKWRSLAFV